MKLQQKTIIDKDLTSVNIAHYRPLESQRKMLLSVISPNFDSYPPIYTYEFTHSYLNKYLIYTQLVSQISTFNENLVRWKNGNNDPHFKNIILIYNVYKNLAERLKTLNFIHSDHQKQLILIKNWLLENKSKGFTSRMGNIANLMKIVAAQKKKKSAKQQEEEQLYMYLKKERTEHPDFRLPKERLLQYKRKDLEVPNLQDPFQSSRNVRTFSSVSKDQKGFSTLRTNQQLTMNSINKQSSAKEIVSGQKNLISITVEQLNIIEDNNQAQIEEGSVIYQEADDQKRNKKPFTSDSINRQAHDRQQIQQFKTTGNFHKSMSLANHIRFLNEHKQLEQIKLDNEAKQKIRTWSKYKSRSAQSLSRRLQSQKTRNRYVQQQFKTNKNIKHEDFPLKLSSTVQKINIQKKIRKTILFDNQIDTYPVFKIIRQTKKQQIEFPQYQQIGHRKKVQSQKLQMSQEKIAHNKIILGSKNKIPYQKNIEKQNQKSRPQQKSSPSNIQNLICIVDNKNEPKIFLQNALETNNQIDRYKLQKTIFTFEKHIAHHRPATSGHQKDNSDEPILNQLPFKKQQGLTHRFNSARSLSFAQILYKNHPNHHNNENQSNISRIKSVLSHKGVTINSHTINNSMKIPIQAKYILNQKMLKTGDRLFSNPFFPKNLYTAKKKKKNKK